MLLKIWMLCDNFEKFTNQSRAFRRLCLVVLLFIEVNFTKITHNLLIFRTDFDFICCHLIKISGQIIECKFLPLTISYSRSSLPVNLH